MRTEQITIYKFSELSDKAKQKAKDDYASHFGYNWGDEAFDSIKKLAEHFGGKVTNYDVDFFNCSHSSMSFDMPDDMTKAEIRRRLKELGTYNRRTLKGHGDCKLTGYCADENAIDGFRIAFVRGKETDLNKLMEAAFRSWLKAAQDDCEDFYSDETFGEHCEANEYEFKEDGSFHPRRKPVTA